MKVIVIGAGLIGLTTAYVLRRRGHEVTVIDRAAGPGCETSFANGGLLTPSMSEPWNSPGCWRTLLGSFGRHDAALQVRLRTLPSLAHWGMAFLRNSSAAAFHRNTISNLRLALYSLEQMEVLRQQTSIEYGRDVPGALRVFRDRPSLERAVIGADRLASQGLNVQRLSTDEAIRLEPALIPIAGNLSGALHYRADETGDAFVFCTVLSQCARVLGVEFHFGTEISVIETKHAQVTAVLSDRGRFVADRYVVSAGSYSVPLLKGVGVHLPVQPAKGYSVTFDRPAGAPVLRVPIVDDQLHAVVVPLPDKIRVAGTAEFAGYDLTISGTRLLNLTTLLKQVLPQFRSDAPRAWCGLRPMSVDGVPIIGCTPISNLFVNTGHGHLGWTMAAGSACLLADLISNEPTWIDSTPYKLARFNAHR